MIHLVYFGLSVIIVLAVVLLVVMELFKRESSKLLNWSSYTVILPGQIVVDYFLLALFGIACFVVSTHLVAYAGQILTNIMFIAAFVIGAYDRYNRFKIRFKKHYTGNKVANVLRLLFKISLIALVLLYILVEITGIKNINNTIEHYKVISFILYISNSVLFVGFVAYGLGRCYKWEVDRE